MTPIDVEIPIPQGDKLVGPMAEENIANAVKLIEAGANPATIARTIYLFGLFDGLVRA